MDYNMTTQKEKEKQEIRDLAMKLKVMIESSDWFKEYYEKAMTKKGNNELSERHLENDDIVFDFETLELDTFPHYEQNSSNLVIRWGYELDKEREARQKKVTEEKENDRVN